MIEFGTSRASKRRHLNENGGVFRAFSCRLAPYRTVHSFLAPSSRPSGSFRHRRRVVKLSLRCGADPISRAAVATGGRDPNEERASERAIPGARCSRCLDAAAGTGSSVRRLLHLTTQCATHDERKFYDRFTVLLESRQRATKPRALLLAGFRNRLCVCSVQKTAIQMLNSQLQLLR